jgi:hypothetical protein
MAAAGVQQNEGTGKEVPLLLPWAIDARALRRDLRFFAEDGALCCRSSGCP